MITGLIVGLASLAGVVLGAWIVGGFDQSDAPRVPTVANITPPTIAELNRSDI